jgi:hypothetical protein
MGAFLMKGEVQWKGGPGSFFKIKVRHFINGSGKLKSSYKNLIESPKIKKTSVFLH